MKATDPARLIDRLLDPTAAFVFPSPGCWDIRIDRGEDTSHVWVEVSE